MRIELRRDLNLVVAKMASRGVNALAGQVAREARTRAPAVRVWVNVDDERVRPAHVDAHLQAIPANLRFKLRKQVYIPGGGRGSRVPGRTVLAPDGFVLAREPRDEDLPPDQSENCRCEAATLGGVISGRVRTSPAVVQGTRVRAEVSASYPRLVESFHGTSGDEPDRWLALAVEAVAARTRGARDRA